MPSCGSPSGVFRGAQQGVAPHVGCQPENRPRDRSPSRRPRLPPAGGLSSLDPSCRAEAPGEASGGPSTRRGSVLSAPASQPRLSLLPQTAGRPHGHGEFQLPGPARSPRASPDGRLRAKSTAPTRERGDVRGKQSGVWLESTNFR